MTSLVDKVIFLKSTKYGDSDLILQALNRSGGKINFIAKSALKSRKRFGGGVLEPLNYVEVTFKPNSDPDKLHILNEAKLINDFPNLRKDYDRLELGLHFVKILDKVSMNEDIHSPENFNLLGNSLKQAEVSERLALLRCMFEVKLLQAQGVLDDSNFFQSLLSVPISLSDSIVISEKEVSLLHKEVHQRLIDWMT